MENLLQTSNLVIALFAAVFLVGSCRKPSDADKMSGTIAPSRRTGTIADASHGEPGIIIQRHDKGNPAPTAAFTDSGGQTTSFKQFAGKPLLVALWSATLPSSIDPLPTLDMLAAEGRMSVVALNVDRVPIASTTDPVDPLWDAQKFKTLKEYRDPRTAVLQALNSPLLPSTYLYDANGKLVWCIVGSVDFRDPGIREALREAN
jgi:thiol-disulfide isomerase/thioredoxin